MNNHIPKIEALHTAIYKSIFFKKQPLTYAKTIKALDLMARLIADYDGDTDDWIYIGEFTCSMDSMLIAAYWHLSHWHSGQWSDEYRALCMIGQIFKPGMSNGPEPDSSEFECYKALDTMARKANGMPIYRFAQIYA